MEIVTDMNVLYEAFKASMKGSAWKEEPQRFEIDFLSEITKLKHELEDKTYKTLQGSEFVLNERGKIRYIHGGRMRDRVVRHALCDNVLNPSLKPYLIYNNGASQKGKGITFARRMFENDLHAFWLKHRSNDGYAGFIDLSKFYDNIRHDNVKRMIFPKIDEFSQWLFGLIIDTFQIDVSYMSDEEYSCCIEQKFDSIVYHNTIPMELRTGKKFMAKSVDIGDQVSQDIGVFYPTRLDNYAKIVRSIKFYGRYMDDIYIIHESRDVVLSVINGLKERAKEMGMFINPKKTKIVKLSGKYKYLQVRYTLTDSGRVIKKISQKAITRERRKLKAYRRLLDRSELKYPDIEQAYKSWMGSFTPIMSKRQIKNMKQLFKELFGKEPRWKPKLTKLRCQTVRKSII